MMENKKKVLLMSPVAPPIGGIARWSKIVLERLNKDNRIDIQHINIAPRYKGKVTKTKRILFGVTDLIRILKEEYRAIKEGIDVLHITTSGSLALFRDFLVLKIAKKHGIATVYHLHFGRIPTIAEQNTREWKIFKKVFTYCNAIIAIDNFTKDTLDSYEFKDITYFVPNPVDVDSLNKECKLVSKTKKIVYVGHVYQSKGVSELIDAWLSIANDFPEYSLELVGSLAESQYIESLPKDESIHYLGEQSHSETMKNLAEASVMVLPSYSEGFPNVILEAMALKVPIIGTKVGAIPEMLSDGCGILIEPKSIVAIKTAIGEVLGNSQQSTNMAEKAYDRVKSQYDIERVAKLYINLWSEI